MYKLKNLKDKNPIQVSGSVIAVVNFAIIMDFIDMTGEQVAGLNTGLIALLGLFVAAKTSNNASLEEL